jgi:uncharacterized protein (TIGR00730 family)
MSLKMTLKTYIDLFNYNRTIKKHKDKPVVTIIGSARVKEDSNLYKRVRKLGNMLGLAEFTVIQGGGPGLMAATAHGVNEVDSGHAIGVTIPIRSEQVASKYNNKIVDTKYFFTRKVCLFKDCDVIIGLPGGFGTLDELFEAITLMQTGKMRKKPIILYDKDFWEPIIGAISGTCTKFDTISKDDLEGYVKILDCIPAVVTEVRRYVSTIK